MGGGGRARGSGRRGGWAEEELDTGASVVRRLISGCLQGETGTSTCHFSPSLFRFTPDIRGGGHGSPNREKLTYGESPVPARGQVRRAFAAHGADSMQLNDFCNHFWLFACLPQKLPAGGGGRLSRKINLCGFQRACPGTGVRGLGGSWRGFHATKRLGCKSASMDSAVLFPRQLAWGRLSFVGTQWRGVASHSAGAVVGLGACSPCYAAILSNHFCLSLVFAWFCVRAGAPLCAPCCV